MLGKWKRWVKKIKRAGRTQKYDPKKPGEKIISGVRKKMFREKKAEKIQLEVGKNSGKTQQKKEENINPPLVREKRSERGKSGVKRGKMGKRGEKRERRSTPCPKHPNAS